MKRRTISLFLATVILFSMTACKANALQDRDDELPEYTIRGETDLPGNFYISFVYSRNLIMMDGKGNVVWSKHEEQPEEGMTTGLWDFKKHVIDGEVYYSYHDQTGEYDDYGLPGYAPGKRVILDKDFHEIKRIAFEESETVEKGHPLDGHDFLMIDLDHYFLSGYIKDTVYNNPEYPEGSSVVYSYLQEVKDGETVWDWKSIDYPELYKLTVTDGQETANDFGNEVTDAPDYIHFNAMRMNEDGDLICSFRHICSILCLDRSKSEDQIKWILSGADDQFGLTEEQKTNCQHYASLDGEYITVFDNENRSGATRICSYRPDTGTMSLKMFRSYAVGGKFSSACGSAQRISGEMNMIGWGHTSNDNVCMSVCDFETGEELIAMELANPNNFTYRCVYYD